MWSSIFNRPPSEPLTPPATTRELVWWNREPLARAERDLNRQLVVQGAAALGIILIAILIHPPTLTIGRVIHAAAYSTVLMLVAAFGGKRDRVLERKRDAAIADQRIRDRILAECARTDLDQFTAPPR